MRSLACLLSVVSLLFGYSIGHPTAGNAIQDQDGVTAAQTARRLVHETNWAAVGSISTRPKTPGYPMVNVISIDDSADDKTSTGKIHFLLMGRDYTAQDSRALNKVTFLFTDEQNKNCEVRGEDPMGHNCARAIISGKIVEVNNKSEGYEKVMNAFVRRHPSAENWSKAHMFYMCELDIESISVMDGYGPYKEVTPEEYYNVNME